MIGVNFQPGANQDNGQNGNGGSRPGSGVQEAIKVLSLRLPKVVGAQAAVPMPLLTSQGGGGNRVDSVVNQVLARVMPGGQMPMGQPQGAGPVSQDQGFLGGANPFQTLQRAPRVNIGDREPQPIQQAPAVDHAPNPYPFERGPAREAPSVDVAPSSPMPAPTPPQAPTDLMSELQRLLRGGFSGGGGEGQNLF